MNCLRVLRVLRELRGKEGKGFLGKITWKYSMIFISIVISTIMSSVNGGHPSMLKKRKLQNEGCLKAWE